MTCENRHPYQKYFLLNFIIIISIIIIIQDHKDKSISGVLLLRNEWNNITSDFINLRVQAEQIIGLGIFLNKNQQISLNPYCDKHASQISHLVSFVRMFVDIARIRMPFPEVCTEDASWWRHGPIKERQLLVEIWH